MVGWLSALASIGMAAGPPLVYVDQAYSIVNKRCALSVHTPSEYHLFDKFVQRLHRVLP